MSDLLQDALRKVAALSASDLLDGGIIIIDDPCVLSEVPPDRLRVRRGLVAGRVHHLDTLEGRKWGILWDHGGFEGWYAGPSWVLPYYGWNIRLGVKDTLDDPLTTTTGWLRRVIANQDATPLTEWKTPGF